MKYFMKNDSIKELALSGRTYNTLMRVGITTINQLLALSIDDLESIKNLGQKGYEEIEQTIRNIKVIDKNNLKNSDIDLLIITRKNMLWTTRALVYGVLKVMGYQLRKPEQKSEKDKLCLNMWLDETSLVWDRKDRNIYTGHEIAQIVPLINKKNIYEKFLF